MLNIIAIPGYVQDLGPSAMLELIPQQFHENIKHLYIYQPAHGRLRLQ